MDVPTMILVRGITIISRIIKGTDLIRFIIIPKIPLSFGIGFIPVLSVTTKITPSGIPITYEKNEEATVINKVSKRPFIIIATILYQLLSL